MCAKRMKRGDYFHIHEYAASTTVDVLVGLMFYLQNKYMNGI